MLIFIKYLHRKNLKGSLPGRPSIWNTKLPELEGVARATTAVEGFDFGIQATFLGSHPSLWKTLGNLKKDATTKKYLCLQSTAGLEFPRRTKYREWR